MKNIFLATGLIFGFPVLTGSVAAESVPLTLADTTSVKIAEKIKNSEAKNKAREVIDLLEKAAPAAWAEYLSALAGWIRAEAEESKARVKLRSAAQAEFDEWRRAQTDWNQARVAHLKAEDELQKAAPDQYREYERVRIVNGEATPEAEALAQAAPEQWAIFTASRRQFQDLQMKFTDAEAVLKGVEWTRGVAELEYFEYLFTVFERNDAADKLREAKKAVQEAAPLAWAEYKGGFLWGLMY